MTTPSVPPSPFSTPPGQPPPKKKPPIVLIVVVIGALGIVALCCISILAAIAVPNFLEAQVRAKVSRSKADLRSLATALEAYYVDWRAYPVEIHAITTPVAYVRQIFVDPFSTPAGQPYRYYGTGGGWILWSYGPDTNPDIVPERDYNPAVSQPTPHLLSIVTFDPTNGTISRGDIWRVRDY